jgi:phosphoribosyl-ATP pyrophosphohydrolase
MELMNDFVSFSLKTFKDADSFSSLRKLREEIMEVEDSLFEGKENLAEEYADCIMCVLDSAARSDINPNEIMNAFAEKLKLNKNRNWIKNPDNTYSHY